MAGSVEHHYKSEMANYVRI